MRIDEYNPENEAEEVGAIARILSNDLSEPYSHYIYQYFLSSWPSMTFLARSEEGEGEGVQSESEQKQPPSDHSDNIIGAIVASVRPHKNRLRGYIAMLAVDGPCRGRGVAKQLIERAVAAMQEAGADEITLETEATNSAALALYERFGFVRSRRMHRYYLNTSDAFRLSLPLTPAATKSTIYCT